jgi:hypothetical protein
MIKISFAALLLACLTACTGVQKPFSQPEPIKNKALKYPGYESSIRIVKDNIIVNPMVIVANKNLQPFIDDLKSSPLVVSYKLDGIPSFIKSFLEHLSGDHFTIANPGKEWNCCCDKNDKLPNRELIYQGKDENLFVMSYYTGGIGEAGHVILIRYNNKTITDFWTGVTLANLQNKDAILKYLISDKTGHYGMMNI